MIWLLPRFSLISAVIWLGFVVITHSFLTKGHWPRFRRGAIIAAVVLPFGSYLLRPIIVQLSYGTKVAEFTELPKAFPHLNLTIYSSGKFISTTYDAAYHVENIGRAEWDEEVLKLEFYDEQSQYLDHKYELVDHLLLSGNQGIPALKVYY